ncbi:hypothetical protein SISNIDRAFT_460979 [Sistotremastrum niveocremeum HHB9708]|uniref:Uncharacterized protein n=1 Tax=Sistotremastrum niveocremeum HHB9708 TaxID=1314777 RepID=A0A164N523_9AGAM|nr:hypothetical protein SISNIDRAFT_460979 [Sistotremastrum niveocremeum HHB9708]
MSKGSHQTYVHDDINEVQTPLSQIVGQYRWVFKDALMSIGPGFLDPHVVDWGGMTISLRNSSSSITLENLTGQLEYGSIKCDILKFREHSDNTDGLRKSCWRLNLKYTGDDDERDEDDGDWIDVHDEHELYVSKQVDDGGTPYLEFVLSMDGLNGHGDLHLLGKKLVDSAHSASWLTADEKARLRQEKYDSEEWDEATELEMSEDKIQSFSACMGESPSQIAERLLKREKAMKAEAEFEQKIRDAKAVGIPVKNSAPAAAGAAVSVQTKKKRKTGKSGGGKDGPRPGGSEQGGVSKKRRTS